MSYTRTKSTPTNDVPLLAVVKGADAFPHVEHGALLAAVDVGEEERRV